MCKIKLFIVFSFDGYIVGFGDDLSFLFCFEGEDFGYVEFFELVDIYFVGWWMYDVVMKIVGNFFVVE